VLKMAAQAYEASAQPQLSCSECFAFVFISYEAGSFKREQAPVGVALVDHDVAQV
jgi:hypothetical protein